MSYFKVILTVISIFLIVSCSNSNKGSLHQAEGDFDYLTTKEREPITMPPDIKAPEHQSIYDIPQLPEDISNNNVGDKVSILPPKVLVLPAD